ncbi:hypothetical protein TNCV_2119111 [Trichonephila clavipes]|nr:hypothetical protein TNCV_2119111 [Trichonephila clavipes]
MVRPPIEAGTNQTSNHFLQMLDGKRNQLHPFTQVPKCPIVIVIQIREERLFMVIALQNMSYCRAIELSTVHEELGSPSRSLRNLSLWLSFAKQVPV